MYVIEFIQAVLLGISLAAPLGPVTILMLNKILKKDIRSAYAISFSAIAGDFSWMILSFFGIAIFVKTWNLLPYLNVLSILILLYLGSYSIYEFFNYKKIGKIKSKNSFFWIYLLTVSNPFTILLWLGIFGVNLNIWYGLSIFLGVVIWFLILPLLLIVLPKAKRMETKRIISLISGIVIIGFALYFALI